ncbi:hypothetical protein ACP70R_002132 [Stipagrostis hirtigluma subsp. patula]
MIIPRTPSLFQIEEGADAPAAPPAASGELVGLRLIIQPSPRQRPPAILRRSAVRAPATSAPKCDESGRTFAGLEFLKRCFSCHKTLDANMDVFVYKGEQAFCSPECRCLHIAKEERREVEALLRKRRDAFHRRHAAAADKMQGSNRHIRLQTAS